MTQMIASTVGRNDAPKLRARQSADVDRWVAMIDAELRTETADADAASEPVSVTLEFGRTTIDLAEKPLQAGDSVPLDQQADEPLEVVVDGRSIARGELVVVDGQLGVRIVELLMLFVTWFALGTPLSLADERGGTLVFDDGERLETPFGTVRSSLTKEAVTKSSALSSKVIDEPVPTDGIPLPRRSEAASRAGQRVHGSASGWSATVWPLLLVVGLIVAGAQWLKSRSPAAARGLPSDVFEILGRKGIDPRTSVLLVRCGSRLLLLSQSTHGLQTLAEITDPVEIDCLAGLCQATARDQSLVETFRSLLHKPSPPGLPITKTVSPSPLDERLAERLFSDRAIASQTTAEVRG